MSWKKLQPTYEDSWKHLNNLRTSWWQCFNDWLVIIILCSVVLQYLLVTSVFLFFLIPAYPTQALEILRSWVLLLHDKLTWTHKKYKEEVDLIKRERYSRLIKQSMNPCKAAWNLINSQRKKDSVFVCSAGPDEVNNCFV